MILGGLLTTTGLVLLARCVRPAPPSLSAALAHLSAEPTLTPTISVPVSVGRRRWLPTAVAELVERHLGVSEADLDVLGWSRDQLAARTLLYAAAGFLAPSLVGVVLLIAGWGGFVVVPVAVGVAVGGVGWFLPSQDAREKAVAARREFRVNLEFFLTLVAGERRARGSVEQALDEAAAVSGSVAFVRMQEAIRRATLAGRKPWTDLRVLGEQLDVAELRNLADIADVAADGAAVYNTLLATAATLRHAELSDRRAEANQVSERMSRPLALLVFGLTLFVLVPFMLHMFTTT